MTLNTLSEFLSSIEAIGELRRITHPVSVDLELCEIADRVMKQSGGGSALLFEHVTLRDGSRSAWSDRCGRCAAASSTDAATFTLASAATAALREDIYRYREGE